MNSGEIKLNYNIVCGDYIRGGEASSDVKRALMQLGIKSSIIRKVCVASYEAEMNIVIHSLGGCLEVIIHEDRIEIKAEDKGPGIENINLAMTEGYSTASEYAREMGFGGGMGLPNMKKNSDEFHISSGPGEHTCIYMMINVR